LQARLVHEENPATGGADVSPDSLQGRSGTPLSKNGGRPMRLSCRFLVVACSAAALAIVPAASAAPGSTNFTVSLAEYAFTSTVGCFTGSGRGNVGDYALVDTCIEHDPLGSQPTYITGGWFAMTTRSPSGAIDYVTGSYVYHGGMVTTINPGPNCTNQQYGINGALEDVATSNTSGGTGTFAGTLTHYRTRVFGRCVTYWARVRASVTFAY
jgi:hypothetical protein